jgi:hypothetical protein
LNNFDPRRDPPHKLHKLLAAAFVLEDRIQLAVESFSPYNNSNLPHNKYPTIIGDIINFFNLPELPTSKKTIFQVIRDHTNPFFVASQAYTS